MFSRDLRPGLLHVVPSGLGMGVVVWSSRDLRPGLMHVVPSGLGNMSSLWDWGWVSACGPGICISG